MKIITTYNPPPITTRLYDWVAIVEGYEPGDPVGYGETEEDAKKDLAEQIEKE